MAKRKRRTRSKSKHVEPGDKVRFKSKRHGTVEGIVASTRVKKRRKAQRVARSLCLSTAGLNPTIAQVANDDFNGYFEVNVLDCTIIEKGFIEDHFIENDASVKVRNVKSARRAQEYERANERHKEARDNDLTTLDDGDEIIVKFRDCEKRVIFRGFTKSGNVRFEQGVKYRTDWEGNTTSTPRIRTTSPEFVRRAPVIEGTVK